MEERRKNDSDVMYICPTSKVSLTLWEEMSLSAWKNTSIIIILDTNANPSAMLAICSWSGGAEITEEKWTQIKC